MIFSMVIYVTLINLTIIECILLLLLKSYLFLNLCVLESLTLEKSNDILWRRKLQKFAVNVNFYRYINLKKTNNYLRTNCCIVINLKNTCLKLNKIQYDI